MEVLQGVLARRPVQRALIAYWLVFGSPGGLISDLVTASSDRPQRSSTLAYVPFSITSLSASASGLTRPLSFLVVAAMSPWRVDPAPE